MSFDFTHKFNAVGQGLFAAGTLNFSEEDTNFNPVDFRWVYDCGTTSSQRFVEGAIRELASAPPNKPLDLLVISHFDADHISGIVELLNSVGASTIMLPWAPLWHRLLIGFQQGLSPNDPEFGFYADPANFLNDQAGDSFSRIVFVPFSNGDGPPEPEIEDGPTPEFGPDYLPELKIPQYESSEREYPYSDLEEWFEYREQLPAGLDIELMRQGSTAQILGVWEFVPYNDPYTIPKNQAQFDNDVQKLRRELLGSNYDERAEALRQLKNFYQQAFPKSQQNDLSLFLYGGPLNGWKGCFGHSFMVEFLLSVLFEDREIPDLLRRNIAGPCKGSIIYTGDGNLNNLEKWNDFSSYLNSRRSGDPTLLQVAHHGSRYNWFEGLADEIRPTVSVFSSDPSHRTFGHPHAEVLRDFWPYHPVQVDKLNSYTSRIFFAR